MVKNTKKLFVRIKKLKPMYNSAQMERDYQHQAFNQKFMREVSYKRPKNWVDPFPKPPAGETEEERRDRYRGYQKKAKEYVKSTYRSPNDSSSIGSGNFSPAKSGHINRIKQHKENSPVKKTKKSVTLEGEGGDSSTEFDTGNYTMDFSEKGLHTGENNQESGNEVEFGDEYEDYEEEDGDRIDLLTTRKKVRVEVETHRLDSPSNDGHAEDILRPTTRERKKEKLVVDTFFAEALIQCWLLDNEFVVISVATVNSSDGDDNKTPLYEAEAEIALADLAVIQSGIQEGEEEEETGSVQGLDDLLEGQPVVAKLASNLPALISLATDIVAYVELIVVSVECNNITYGRSHIHMHIR